MGKSLHALAEETKRAELAAAEEFVTKRQSELAAANKRLIESERALEDNVEEGAEEELEAAVSMAHANVVRCEARFDRAQRKASARATELTRLQNAGVIRRTLRKFDK